MTFPNPPAVSVAIATFNRAGMVDQAVRAALEQTLAPTEICVSDDASTDRSWETLTRIANGDVSVRVFRRSVNSGGVDNWNHAIQQTRGGYIAWCSDDDRYLPDHLEASVAYLEAHPRVGLVHSGFIDVVETPAGSHSVERPLRFIGDSQFEPGDLLTYLLRYYDWPFHASTIVMRRKVWEEVGAFDTAYALADTDWFVRAAERFPVTMLARHGILNRRHAGNWSNRLGSARMQREIREIVERSIARTYKDAPWTRTVWKFLWRANVRLRLALTLAARLRSRHGPAAGAAWREMLRGMPVPRILAGGGEKLIARWCARGQPLCEDARESVSPL